jgi:hypothetical protein
MYTYNSTTVHAQYKLIIIYAVRGRKEGKDGI